MNATHTLKRRHLLGVVAPVVGPCVLASPKVSATELKAGLGVVVEASGDSLDDLLPQEARIVASPTKK